MTSRDRVIRTLLHAPVDRVPRDLWVAAAVEALRADEVAEITFRYPSDMVRPEFRPPKGNRAKGSPHEVGEHMDAWGCVWQVTERGYPGRLAASPLADLGQLGEYRLPWELVEKAHLAAVNRFVAATSRFVLAATDVRPFERLQHLRGPEAARGDLAAGARPIRDLLDMLHDFFCREIELWAASDVDGVAFQDDWGPAGGLPIPVQAWRELFRPLYREYCEILHARDKFAFFHTGGEISAIFGELVEAGVDAIAADYWATDLERLAEEWRGRVTFWDGIDPQRLSPAATPDDVRAAVRRLRAAVDFGHGGVIARCDWSPQASFNHVAAFFETWLAPMPMHAQR
jgi:hypothetical protein